MNAPRVTCEMHRCNDDDGACASNEEDAVRKPMNKRPAEISKDCREPHRIRLYVINDGRNLFEKFPSETFTLFFVPVIGSSNVGFRIRADNEMQSQVLLRIRSFTSDQGEPASGF